jgi:phage gpG-like protein
MDQYDYIGYAPMGIGDAWQAAHGAVSAGAEGADQVRNVTKTVRKATKDVNEFAQKPSWEGAESIVRKYAPSEEQVNEMNGSGVGDQMFASLSKRMNGSGMNTGNNRRYGAGSSFIGSVTGRGKMDAV